MFLCKFASDVFITFLPGNCWIRRATKLHTHYDLGVNRKYHTHNLVILSNPHLKCVREKKFHLCKSTLIYYV